MLAPGTILVSRYRVLSQIGRGGMGEVYLVEHVNTGDRAALKVLHGAASGDPESIERFKREARAPARIQSENVVRVLDADTAPELQGAQFLVMELLTGNDLQKIVAQHGPLPPQEVARVLGQVARALDKAHAMGIVHRDLKPENLFLHQREDGTSVVKILDFGISKTMDDAMMTGMANQLTRTGAVMGTPLYMAIEQALGKRELVGPGTDVWALGLIAIFLLTGEAYWQGRTVPDILGKVLSHAMYPPSSRWPHLPPAIDHWILRSCARMPEQRFATAGWQIAELTEILRMTTGHIAIHGTDAQAATMLPPQSYTPAYTPAHVTPHLAPNIGASTNEPMVHATAPNMQQPVEGMSFAAKVGIVFVSMMLVLGGLMIAVFAFVWPKIEGASEAMTVSTIAAPTVTETVPPASTLEPLNVTSATATTTAKPHATSTTPMTTATVTATATHAVSHAQCRGACKASCVDANDMQDCLMTCLRKCPQ